MFQQLFQPSIRNISPGEAEVGLEYLDLSPHPALAHGRRHGSHAQPASVGGGEAEYLAEVKRRQTLQPLGISEPETILDIQVDFFSNQNGGKHHYIII